MCLWNKSKFICKHKYRCKTSIFIVDILQNWITRAPLALFTITNVYSKSLGFLQMTYLQNMLFYAGETCFPSEVRGMITLLSTEIWCLWTHPLFMQNIKEYIKMALFCFINTYCSLFHIGLSIGLFPKTFLPK